MTKKQEKTVEQITVDPVILKGRIFSIHIHDHSMAEDSYAVCNLLQSIAQGIQRQRIKAEDMINSMEENAKRRMERGDMDPDTGELMGLTPDQEILMDKLEDQLDIVPYIQEDLEALWKEHNDNPEYKLLWQTDAERRKRTSEFQQEQLSKQREEKLHVLEANRKIRQARREARQTRLAS